PASAAMRPLPSGNPTDNPDPIPNLVPRSVYPHNIVAPGVSSYASALNSAPADPANPRRGDVTVKRWNKHFLIPKADRLDEDSADPVGAFLAPDWVILTRGPRPSAPTVFPVSFSTWESTLGDPTPGNDLCAIGRFAYAIYDEGGLIDI